MRTARTAAIHRAVWGTALILSVLCFGVLPGHAEVSPTAIYHADGSTADALGGSDGTLHNGANYRAGVSGQSFAFDGVDDYFQTPFAQQGPFTVSLWVQADELNQPGASSVLSTANTGFGAFQIDVANGQYRFAANSQDGSQVAILLLGSLTTYFQHIAVTYDGTQVKGYLNGQLADAGSLSGIGFEMLKLGRNRNNDRYFDGAVDEVKIFSHPLSATEVTDLYSFPPAASYPAEGSAEDIVGGSDGTLHNGATYRSGAIGQSFEFDGVDDYFQAPFAQQAPFTVSLWVQADDLNQANLSGVLSSANTGNGAFQIEAYGGQYRFRGSSSDGSQTSVVLGDIANSFQHIVVAYDGDQVTCFLDGQLTDTGALTDVGFQLLKLGRNRYNNGYFGGAVDEVKIFSHVLTSVQIADLYNNPAPVAYSLQISGVEDTEITGEAATDPFADHLTFRVLSSVSNGQLTLNPNGAFSYRPNPDFNGTEAFTFIADDGNTDSNVATISVTVNPVNDPPVVDAISDQTIDEWQTLTVNVSAGDQDGTTPSLVLEAGAPAFVTLADNSDGTGELTITPDYTDAGTYTNIGVTAIDAADNQLTATTYFDVIVTDVVQELVAHYNAENGFGDVTGHGHDGSESGGVAFADGPFGQALVFDGVDDLVRVPLEQDGPFTVSLWVQTDDVNQAAWTSLLASSDDRTEVGSFQIDFDGSAGYRLRRRIDDGSVADLSIGSVTTSFQHIALTFDGWAVRTYLDGVPADPVPSSEAQFTRLKLGVNRNGAAFFEGALDEVRIYNYALSVEDITVLASFPPTLDHVEDIVVIAGESVSVPITSSDRDEVQSSLSLSTAPSELGMALTDNGNGTGTLTVSPVASADPGVYGPFTVTATDASSPDLVATQSFEVTVLPEPPPFVLAWGSRGSGAGRFNQANGVDVDGEGYVYVAELGNHRIQKFDSAGNLITRWGSFGTQEGQFKQAFGIAVDNESNVYVSDLLNHRIQKFDSAGSFITTWGSEGSAPGQFGQPRGIAVDGEGNVYVADQNNNRIQKFGRTGDFISSWGTGGSGNGQFFHPQDVAVDGADNIYVADANNHRVQKFDSDGSFIRRWGSHGSSLGQFNQPRGIAVDKDDFVFVTELQNHRIQKFNSVGDPITAWGTEGAGDGQLNKPRGIAVDGGGNIYVAEQINHRVQLFGAPALRPVGDIQVHAGESATTSVQAVSQSQRGIRLDLTSSSVPPELGLTLNDNGNGTGTVTASPDVSATPGVYGPFTVTAFDGTDDTYKDTQTFSVEVASNRAPEMAEIGAQATPEDTPLALNLSAADEDGDELAYTATSASEDVTASLSGATLTLSPSENFHGEVSVQVDVDDGNGGTDSETFALTVTPVNDAPVAAADAVTTDEDVAAAIPVLDNDGDVDGDALSVSSFTQGANGSVVQSGTSLTYTPNPDFNGSDSFSYTVADGNGGSAEATVSVTVTPVNDVPVATAEAVTTDEDMAVSIDVLSNDSDVDGDALTVSVVEQGTNGTVETDGSQVTYTPNLNFNGSDSFSYTVDDGNGGSAEATVSVTVTPVNDAPIAAFELLSPELHEGSVVEFDARESNDEADAANSGHISAYRWDFGDGTPPVVEMSGNTSLATHVYADNSEYTVRLDVQDNEGLWSGFPPATLTVVVNNVAPVLVLDPVPEFILPSVAVEFGGVFSDAGILDTHTAAWSFGNGATIDESLVENGGAGTLAATHVYDESGLFTLTVTVTDKDGGMVSESVVVEVFSPAAAADEMGEIVAALEDPPESLVSQLEGASEILEGNPTAGVNKMNSIKKSINAQRGKKLTEEEANELLALADVVIESAEAEPGPGKGKGKGKLTKPVVRKIGDGSGEQQGHTFGLDANYPNPFNPSTTIRYSLAEPSEVQLTVYNLLGQKVLTLVDAVQAEGVYGVKWNGRDAFGREVATGMYIYHLKAGMNVAIRKMVFAK